MDAGEVHELNMDRKGRVRKALSPMFLIGNLLIIGGLVMLLGIGGWYAFQSYTNDQQLQQFEHEGALIEPTPLTYEQAGVAHAPTAEPTMPPPKLPSGPTIADWTNALKKQTDDPPAIRISNP